MIVIERSIEMINGGRGKDIIICNVSSAVDKKKRFLKGCLLALCCLCFNVFGNSLFFSLKRSGMQVQYDCVSSLFISSLLLLLYSRFLQNGHGSSMINDEYGNIKQAKVPFTFSEKTCLCGFAPPKLQSRASYVWLQYKVIKWKKAAIASH
uniref:Transmembrane protein n=1 Tax=Daphnia magna TaxID=35525 RepID=A0A0P4X3G1_9CRUS